MSQKSLSGLQVIKGFYVEDVKSYTYKELINYYEEISKRDPIASTSIESLISPIISARWNLQRAQKETERSKEARELINWTFDNLSGGFQRFKYHYYLKYRYGSSWFEKVWDVKAKFKNKPVWQLKKLSPFKCNTIWKYHFNPDGENAGELNAITQQAIKIETGEVSYPELNRSDLLISTFNEEYGDIRGQSVFSTILIPYLFKKDLLQSDSTMRLKASGFPIGTIDESLFLPENASLLQEVKNTLSSFGYSKNAYGLEIKDKAIIRNEALQNVSDNSVMLAYYDRVIFYNTQTQWMLAGIGEGQNGGRANTNSHKATYYNRANQALYQFDEDINKLCLEIVANSYLGAIPQEEMPYFESTKIDDTDIFQVAQTITQFGDKMHWRLDDEIWFRNRFGMPEITINDIPKEDVASASDGVTGSAAIYIPLVQSGVITPEEMRRILKLPTTPGFIPVPLSPNAPAVNQETQLSLKGCSDLHLATDPGSNKMSDRAKQICELASMQSHFENMDEKAQKTLDEIYQQAIKDLAVKIKADPKIKIQLGRYSEVQTKLTKLYNQSYELGQVDLKKEINKAKTIQGSINTGRRKKGIELNLIRPISEKEKLAIKIKRLWDATNSAIENDLMNLTSEFIENYGGLEKYIIDNYLDGQKGLRSELSKYTSNGYLDGQAELIKTSGESITEWEYSAVMDKKVCGNCAPFDGESDTLEGWKADGITPGQPVNPGCDGGDFCRCKLIPLG